MSESPEPQHPKKPPTLALVAGGGIIIAVMLVIAVVVVVFSRGGGDGQEAAPTSSSSLPPLPSTSTPPAPQPASGQLPSFTPSADLGANCQYQPAREAAAKQVDPPRSGEVPTDPAEVSADMATDQGPIGLLLDNGKSPCTVNSFVSLAQQGYFDNTACHRLTTGSGLSVLQCGDPTGNGTGGPGYQFANEYPTDQYQSYDPALRQPVIYPRGTVAMANAGPGTNGSQFFLVYQDSQLPPQYTVFGTIQDDGLATLDKIAAGGVDGGGTDGSPATKVTITSVQAD